MSETKKGKILKINEQNEMLTIQTNELALQIIFNIPILNVCNYHEQLEKYNYRAALSGINLKLDEFDQYYSSARQRIDIFYNTLMYRSVAMIQDLLIGVKFAKIQMWREQTAITNGLRLHLYNRDVDPYYFNTQQFNSDIKLVNEIGRANTMNCKEGQQMIGQLLNKLKQVQSYKMQQMFSGRVHSPYLAMNKQGVQVDPSSMYESYLTYLLTKMQRSNENIMRKYFTIHDEIIKFGQTIFDHNVKYQKNAVLAIKKYNDSLPSQHQRTNIAPIIKMEVKRQHFDVDQLLPGRQNRSESKPALINNANKVQFKETNRLLDLQTMTQQTVDHINKEQRKQYQRKLPEQAAVRESPFQTFAEQRRILYKDHYQHRDFQKKIREQQIRYGSKEVKERQKQKIIIRRIVRSINVPAPWLELAEYECPFIQFLNSRIQKEQTIWESRTRSNDKVPSIFSKKDKDNPMLFINREKQQKAKQETEMNVQNQRKQKMQREQAFAFEDRRYGEEQARLAKIKHKMVNRTYEMYMKMNKLQYSPAYVNNQQVSRFGITLRTVLNLNDPALIDRFFFNYYKERYYRENDHVKEIVDNPIILLDSKKVNMSATSKVVGSFLSSLLKRIHSLDFFLLWSDDIICFRLKETKQTKIAEFQCYNYVQSNNTQKLIYEIRRRTNLQIKDHQHLYTKLQSLDMVFSKIQVVHRMIFNRHRTMPAVVSSVMKGRQLAEQIFQQLKER